MKATLTGFFDHDGKLTFKEQLELAKKHQIDAISIRYYDRKPVLEITDKEIKTIHQLLKDYKIKGVLLDTLIGDYDLNSDNKAKEAYDEFKYLVKVSNLLKINHLLIRLPKFTDVMEELENIKIRLQPWITYASKHNKKLILYPSQRYKANTYAYIFKKIKSTNLFMLFDPVYFMSNHESTTTAYRVLKKKIYIFSCHDADHDLNPKLIGYGKTDIVSLFKKLIRDHFSGFLLVDNKFHQHMFEPTVKKETFFSKVFSKKKKREKEQIDELSRRIFPNEETKNVTYDDILDNQIKVVNIVFKK